MRLPPPFSYVLPPQKYVIFGSRLFSVSALENGRIAVHASAQQVIASFVANFLHFTGIRQGLARVHCWPIYGTA